jgi:superfamily II DNA or RNA helicase
MYHQRKFRWKTYQPRVLKMLATFPYGRYELPTAWGKTTLIFSLAALFPRAKIHVVTRSCTLLKEIHRDLSAVVGSVGLFTGSSKQRDCRITCLSAGSLHHSDFDADFVIGDEVHELATEKPLEELAKYVGARFIGLSASQEMRADKRDFALEGLFGPLRIRVPYAEVAGRKEITPIRVLWRRVPGPILRLPPKVEANPGLFNRVAIWRNHERNRLIAKDALHFVGLGKQVLITVSTIEHAMAIKAAGNLEDFQVVWAASQRFKPCQMDRWIRDGLVKSYGECRMTPQRAGWLKKQFESGQLRGAIATPVWNTGVNFLQLDVLIRAEGIASEIRSVQTSGRLSRLFEGKEVGVVVDYLDGFHSKTDWRAQERKKRYRLMGWEQMEPTSQEKTDP